MYRTQHITLTEKWVFFYFYKFRYRLETAREMCNVYVCVWGEGGG
jgi:hypothetical protein